jgi:hypothetical protein
MKQRIQTLTKLSDRECEVVLSLAPQRIEADGDGSDLELSRSLVLIVGMASKEEH